MNLFYLMLTFLIPSVALSAGAGTATINVKKLLGAGPRALTVQYEVRLQCTGEAAFLQTPLKRQKFKWRLAELSQGEAVTDNSGVAQFSYTVRGKISDNLEIEINGKTYKFTSSEGVSEIPDFPGCRE